SANRVACGNNLHEIAVALQLYEGVNGRLPPSALAWEGPTWAWLILPFLDQENMYNQWLPGQAFFQVDAQARVCPVPGYFCPSRRSPDGAGVSDPFFQDFT